ncbi:unnamed protein product, partial [Larinioides sclopetarius]
MQHSTKDPRRTLYNNPGVNLLVISCSYWYRRKCG